MSVQYQENPFIFINSTDSSVPFGRNVRAQVRSQQASRQAASLPSTGEFGVLTFDLKTGVEQRPVKTVRKRRTAAPAREHEEDASKSLVKRRNRLFVPTLANAFVSLDETADLLSVPPNPSQIMALATFHIRRTAAISVRADPACLSEILRCRQWSCVSVAFERFGKSPCLDSAILCVASKLRQITGGPSSALSVLTGYNKALRNLQIALQDPLAYDTMDTLTATQLLAVYEMLDGGLESCSWRKHIAGVESLVQSRASKNAGLPPIFAQVVPMFTDALLRGSEDYFEYYPWRTLIQSVIMEYSPSAGHYHGLLSCLFELPCLLADANTYLRNPMSAEPNREYALLDKAHVTKSRLRTALLGSELYTQPSRDKAQSFDVLGLCLAALVALDRLIASLRPAHQGTQYFEDKTDELCTQLLQLELGAAEGYPAMELMSAFSHQGAFIVALPGKSSD